ncbi:MAG TPA: IPT/TIG domain-containing protein [Solirubrobacteraceae bacterium]|jgi:hypothetical protein
MRKHANWVDGGKQEGRRGSARRWTMATLGAVLALAALVASAAASSPPTIESINHKTGPEAGGQKLVITGTNLSGATAVHFGAAEASFTVVSATEIDATSPPGEGKVAITVTTPEGTSAHSKADEYIYEAPQLPMITKISPNKGPAAGGVTVTITGLNFDEASAVTFGETPAVSFTVNSSTSITAVSPEQSAGAEIIKVTTPNGPSALSYCGPHNEKPCTIRDRYKVETPTVSGVSPSSGPTSGGTLVTITGTGFELGTSNTAITFSGKSFATDVECLSSTECTAITPAHKAQTVDIRVKVKGAGGLAATTAKSPLTDHFTFSG